jgi:hypothetical protein
LLPFGKKVDAIKALFVMNPEDEIFQLLNEKPKNEKLYNSPASVLDFSHQTYNDQCGGDQKICCSSKSPNLTGTPTPRILFQTELFDPNFH